MIIFGVVRCPMGYVLYVKNQARSAKENKFVEFFFSFSVSSFNHLRKLGYFFNVFYLIQKIDQKNF
jgi:hypothetical protein